METILLDKTEVHETWDCLNSTLRRFTTQGHPGSLSDLKGRSHPAVTLWTYLFTERRKSICARNRALEVEGRNCAATIWARKGCLAQGQALLPKEAG